MLRENLEAAGHREDELNDERRPDINTKLTNLALAFGLSILFTTPFIALADDHHQRWIIDMGLPGPDAGKGGKHLILPPGYKGDVPAGYYVGRSSSFKVLVAIRSLPVKGDVKGAIEGLRSIKIYPLASAANPKLLKFIDITEKKMDGTSLPWEDNLRYWEVLHRIINAEPVVDEFRPMYGMLAAVGIEKGKPFAPDARLKGILERAAKVGRDQMLVAAFASDRPDKIAWSDRKWEWVGLIADNSDFETPTGLDLEARDRWFAQAIVASPAMFRRSPGAGSLYWLGVRDKTGAYLDGGKTYKLTVPQPVPNKLFWSVTVYDAATRSEIQTDQDKAALRSLFELKNMAGSSISAYTDPTNRHSTAPLSAWRKAYAPLKWSRPRRPGSREHDALHGIDRRRHGRPVLVSPAHIDAAPRAAGPHEHRSSCLQQRIISALQPHWPVIIHPVSRVILRP